MASIHYEDAPLVPFLLPIPKYDINAETDTPRDAILIIPDGVGSPDGEEREPERVTMPRVKTMRRALKGWQAYGLMCKHLLSTYQAQDIIHTVESNKHLHFSAQQAMALLHIYNTLVGKNTLAERKEILDRIDGKATEFIKHDINGTIDIEHKHKDIVAMVERLSALAQQKSQIRTIENQPPP